MDIDLSKKYGLLLSGGLDSAVLLYLIIKQAPAIDLQPYTIPKHDGSALYADPIITHMNHKFNLSIPQTILVGDPDVHHAQQSSIALREIFQKYNPDFVFMGTNTNPAELDNIEGAPKRILNTNNPRLLTPFAYMTKDQILKIIYDEDQEDLADITHSCTEQRLGRCNRCWQCGERAWAFRQLGKIDTGTL
jgi:hypothetical protein